MMVPRFVHSLARGSKAAGHLLEQFYLRMIWGLVVGELEGRQSSDVLLACLACSFILASGVVKDVGRYLMFEEAFRNGGCPRAPVRSFYRYSVSVPGYCHVSHHRMRGMLRYEVSGFQ